MVELIWNECHRKWEELMKDYEDIDLEFLRRMMSFESLGYKLKWVKKFMMPVYYMDNFSLYVVDFDDKVMIIMDPCETSEVLYEMQCKHQHNALKVLKNLRRCINELIEDWYVPTGEWNFQYNVGMHSSCEREESGTYIVHYIREFNGTWLTNSLTPSRLEYLRRSLAYMVITMPGNQGFLPDFRFDERH